MNLEYKNLYKSESAGRYGPFGIKIEVAARQLPDLSAPAIESVVYDAARKIEAEVRAAIVAADPEAQQRRVAERAQIVGLFPTNIFVEEIPNGYCSDWCCRHLPWFIVTATVGRIKIGWRKRVINIDWTETIGTKTSKELFAAEEVTKDERLIHAWSEEKAREYIAAIIASTS